MTRPARADSRTRPARPRSGGRPSRAGKASAPVDAEALRGIRVTHPDKPYWPDDGFTKLEDDEVRSRFEGLLSELTAQQTGGVER